MKIAQTFPALILSFVIIATPSDAATPAQYYTATKLGLVHTGFVAFGFWKSDEYLWNWQVAKGYARQFPLSSFSNDVSLYLAKQKSEIIGVIQRGIKNGTYKQGTYVRIPSPISGMPRPGSYTDFTYAIGGCTINSYADVNIGRADSYGKITCTVINWSSILTDIYTFNKSDSFNPAGITFFPVGELYGFEQAGLAKKFSVSTSGFYSKSLLGTFTASR